MSRRRIGSSSGLGCSILLGLEPGVRTPEGLMVSSQARGALPHSTMMGKLPLGVVSPYVKMSSGGCSDPLKFYATSYCTAYGEDPPLWELPSGPRVGREARSSAVSRPILPVTCYTELVCYSLNPKLMLSRWPCLAAHLPHPVTTVSLPHGSCVPTPLNLFPALIVL